MAFRTSFERDEPPRRVRAKEAFTTLLTPSSLYMLISSRNIADGIKQFSVLPKTYEPVR